MMKSLDLLNYLTSDVGRIESAIEASPEWQLWMQPELAILLGEAGIAAACDVPYPAPYTWFLSVLGADLSNQRYAIELCPEAGPVVDEVNARVRQIANYTTDNLIGKFVVGIAYSEEAKIAFRAMNDPAILVREQREICFLVWDVTPPPFPPPLGS